MADATHGAVVSAESRDRIADLLDQLANGDSVILGEFGDNAESTDADEDAMGLRELAQKLRGGYGTGSGRRLLS